MSIPLRNYFRRRQVYSPSMTRRPLQLSFLACLLALLTASGSALPPPVLWQCHHAARVVLAPFAAMPSAMPCRMTGMPMSQGPMACCPSPQAVLSKKATAQGKPLHQQALSRPPCDPTFTSLHASPAAQVRPSQDGWSLHQTLSPVSDSVARIRRPACPGPVSRPDHALPSSAPAARRPFPLRCPRPPPLARSPRRLTSARPVRP